MSNSKRPRRSRRFRDWFKKPAPPVETPSYDPGEGESKPEEESTPKSRWTRWREDRRKYVIERKKAQAGIAKHRKWVLMWVAVIVVAIVILALSIMSKFTVWGWIF